MDLASKIGYMFGPDVLKTNKSMQLMDVTSSYDILFSFISVTSLLSFFLFPHPVSVLVPEAVTDSQDITPQTTADQILITTMAAELQMTLGITPEPDTAFEASTGRSTGSPIEHTSVATGKPISETELEVELDAIEGPVKTLNITVQHEEVEMVSESDRTPEEFTSRVYDYEISTTFEDLLGISTSPTIVTTDFTEELYLETELGQDVTDGPGVTIQHESDVVSKSTLLTTDRTPEDYTSKKHKHDIPTTLDDSPGISTNTPMVIISQITEELHSESEPEMGEDATQGLVKTAGVTIQHEEVDIVSESTLMTTDRTPEDSTSGKYEYVIPTSFEDSIEIITSSPTVLTNEATVKQDVTEGPVKTLYVTIPNEKADIVSESTLMTTDSTPEDSTSGKYEYVIPTSFEDSLEIITSSPTELTNEATVKATVKQDATEGPVKTEDVTIPHEEFDIVSESTLMTTDRNPEDTTLENYEYILPTSFEDSLGIITISPTELTSEAIVKKDVTEGLVKTAEVTIPHEKFDIVSESTLMTNARNLEDSTSGKYDYGIPTSFEDSVGISTNTPKEITSESTEEISVTKLYMGQGVTEGPLKSADATIQHVEADVVSEATLMTTGRTPVGSTSRKYETDQPTTLGDLQGISTNTREVVTRESIEHFISETEVEGVTETPVKSALVTIQHVDVSEATMSTHRPAVDSLTEIPPVQSVLPEKPAQTAPTALTEVSPNPPTEGLPKALTDKDVVEITHVTTKPEILSPTTPVNTSPEVVSTEGGPEDIAIDTLRDKDEEEETPYTKPTPEVPTDEELPGTMTESTHELSKETYEPIDDSSDAEEDHLGKEEDIITETPEVVEVTAGETPRLTQETTEATEATVFTEKDKHVDKDITAIAKPGEMITEPTGVAEVEFDITTDDVLENMLEDFVGGTSETTSDLGDATEAVILEESSEKSTTETSIKRTETSTKTTSQTTTGITSKATPDTFFDIGTPETDIVEFETEGMEDKVEDTTKKNEGGEETLFIVFEGTMPDLTVTKLEKDILTTTINEDIREVTEPSKIQQDTPKVEITHEVSDLHETRGDSLSETPGVAMETPKAITEADVMTETTYDISQAPKVISQAPEVETSGSISKKPEVISQTPLSISELSEVPETVPKTPDIRVVQSEPAEDDIPTPILKVEDMAVVLNDLTTTIQKTFSTTLQNLPQDISNDILDENSMVSTLNL